MGICFSQEDKATADQKATKSTDQSNRYHQEALNEEKEQNYINEEIKKKDQELFQKYQESYYLKNNSNHMSYGTAGFRDKHYNLDFICFRVGVFQAYCSKIYPSQVLGIQITASHNKIEDNGIKQSDFDGTMLKSDLECLVNVFVTSQDLNKAIHVLVEKLKVIKRENSQFQLKNEGMLFVGSDTRPSCNRLVKLIEEGASAANCKVKHFTQVTTPMLHWFVKYFNSNEHKNQLSKVSESEKFINAYYDQFNLQFDTFFQTLGEKFTKQNQEKLIIDCANGVGGLHMHKFFGNLQKRFNAQTINACDSPDKLNEECGAEFIHKERKFPLKFEETIQEDIKQGINITGISFDGDADRIVYFLPNLENKQMNVLDGDRILVLFASFFIQILGEINQTLSEIKKQDQLTQDLGLKEDFQWRVGVIQTAYANGASTNYIRNVLKKEVDFAATGVKYLHPKAHDSTKYDVGLYCESNGHGTFIVEENKIQILKSEIQSLNLKLKNKPEIVTDLTKALVEKLTLLYSFIETQNKVVGDAQTNCLCIQEALAFKNINCQNWLNLYQDKFCKNSTVKGVDRTKFKTTPTEDTIIEPKALQEFINSKVEWRNANNARAFVRPSGTENLVRIYVESNKQDDIIPITEEITDALSKEPSIQLPKSN